MKDPALSLGNHGISSSLSACPNETFGVHDHVTVISTSSIMSTTGFMQVLISQTTRNARLAKRYQIRLQSGLSSRYQSSYQQHPIQRDDDGRLLSRVSGPSTMPLSNQTLGQFWQGLVEQHGDRPALIVRHEPSDQHSRMSASAETPITITDAESKTSCLRWSYSDMEEHVRRLAKGLQDAGVKRGARVAVMMMNNSAMASLQVATAMVGAILVTLNPSYTARELLNALNHVEASHLFIVPSLRSSNYLENLQAVLPSLKDGKGSHGDSTLLEDPSCPSLKRIIVVDNLSNRPGRRWSSESLLGKDGYTIARAIQQLQNKVLDYRDVVANDGKLASDPGLACHDIINLQLTSGTTGKPKAVALSSRNLVNNGIMLGQVMHLTSSDILTNVPPLFHCFGLTLGNMAAWSAGACVLYPSEGFNPVRALRAAAEEGATAMHGVPAHFIAELDVLERVRQAQKSSKWDQSLTDKLGIDEGEDWQFQLRTGFTSGSTVPIELMRSIMDPELLGAKEQTVVYGMTETSPVTFGCDTSAAVKLRCQTVGRVVPHVEAKIIDPTDNELGNPLPVGQIGELCTAGYVVMDGGYWQDKARTNEVLQRHTSEPDITWMRTGDLAVMDEDGYTEIKGRVKDMIIRGGENLTATDIENCIDQIPGIASCAVVAVPDPKLGETVGVFFSRASNSEVTAEHLQPAAIRAYVKQHMSGQCAPEWVWCLGGQGVPSIFPATASGKVQKVELRKWAQDLAEEGVGHAKRNAKA